MVVTPPTREELLEALEAMIFPAYGEKLKKEDGKGPCTRGMDLLLRAKGLHPQGIPKAPIRSRPNTGQKKQAPIKRGLGF